MGMAEEFNGNRKRRLISEDSPPYPIIGIGLFLLYLCSENPRNVYTLDNLDKIK
jgi:hypothetical protein